MPIDISTERTLSLLAATAMIPSRRRGRKPAVSTLYRWALSGVRGVRLETIQVGGTRCTSVEAMQRFFDTLSVRNGVNNAIRTAVVVGKCQEDQDHQLDQLWNR